MTSANFSASAALLSGISAACRPGPWPPRARVAFACQYAATSAIACRAA